MSVILFFKIWRNKLRLCACFFMVCEKNKYVLLAINSEVGTSFTPNNISQLETSSFTSIPNSEYDSLL